MTMGDRSGGTAGGSEDGDMMGRFTPSSVSELIVS